eukprot:7384821-Prymnesium_polylepis.3
MSELLEHERPSSARRSYTSAQCRFTWLSKGSVKLCALWPAGYPSARGAALHAHAGSVVVAPPAATQANPALRALRCACGADRVQLASP